MPDANSNPKEFDLTSDLAPRGNEGSPATDPGPPAPRQSIIPPDIANKIPEGMRETLEFSMMAMGPMGNPLAQHVTPEHIGKIIDNQEAASVRKDGLKGEELKDKKHIRLTNCVAGIVLLLVTGLLWGFPPC